MAAPTAVQDVGDAAGNVVDSTAVEDAVNNMVDVVDMQDDAAKYKDDDDNAEYRRLYNLPNDSFLQMLAA